MTEPRSRRWRPVPEEIRLPPTFHIADFAASELDEVVALFRSVFRREVPAERVRRGLAHRYLDNPYTGAPATAPIVIRPANRDGPMVGFMGCVPTPVRFLGRDTIAPYIMDVCVREDYPARRIGSLLIRALASRATGILFTSSAGLDMQTLLRFYGLIPLPEFERAWTLPLDAAAPPPPRGLARLRRVLASAFGRRATVDLRPIESLADGATLERLAAQAARHTAEASYLVRRTPGYLAWRFAPVIRAAMPECALWDLAVTGRSLGWLVTRRRADTLDVLDWFVPRALHAAALGAVAATARGHGCRAVSGRGMLAELTECALAHGAIESREMTLYWTWAPDYSVYDGMDWRRAYLSATDGDLALPWNLDPAVPLAAAVAGAQPDVSR